MDVKRIEKIMRDKREKRGRQVEVGEMKYRDIDMTIVFEAEDGERKNEAKLKTRLETRNG